ncbi:MAG: hypothetical protein ABUL72_01660, partial [Armatimonadota bacterium]
MALAIVGSATQTWAADSRVTGVDAKKVDAGLEISVSGSNLLRPKVVRAQNNQLYILEFEASLDGKKQSYNVGNFGVRTVQVSWFTPRPPRVRVALRLDPGVEPELISRDGTWIILVRTSGASTPQPLDPKATDLTPTDQLPAFAPTTAALRPDETLRTVPKTGSETDDLSDPQRAKKKAASKIKTPPQ